MANGLRQSQERQKICVCCVCGQARDDIAADHSWYSLKAHLRKYGIQKQDLMFSHTYCPGCIILYKEKLGLGRGRAGQVLKTGRGAGSMTMSG
jgi:hypothetical protein